MAEQDGIVTRAQAMAAGMTRHQIEWALRADGPWQRVLQGVYATFTGPLGQSHREGAALLACGEDAQLAALTACRPPRSTGRSSTPAGRWTRCAPSAR